MIEISLNLTFSDDANAFDIAMALEVAASVYARHIHTSDGDSADDVLSVDGELVREVNVINLAETSLTRHE